MGSVANLTREDTRDLLALATRAAVRAQTYSYPLEEAERALEDMRVSRFEDTAVIDLVANRRAPGRPERRAL